jgi:type IV fimbrial biogenesis protein FimT
MRLCNKQSGFTLTEMMIVIAITAIFAAIAVPNFLSYLPKHRLNGAARQVMGDLMAARMKAVSQNNDFKVLFDISINNHEYTILYDDNNDGNIDVGEWTQTKDIQSEYSDVTFSNVTADPIFRPRGTAYGTTITLTNSAGSKYVKVAITGRVKIDDTP